MVAIITEQFRLNQAKDFLDNFTDVSKNLYFFIARSRPWPTDIVNHINENSPPAPQDDVSELYGIWDNILGLKKIDSSDTTLVIPRFNWDSTGNTIYKPYDDQDADLFNHPTQSEVSAANLGGYTAGSFFIITDELNIFKCLNNNNGAKSTVKPTLPLSSPWIVSTSDGYQWKFMASVSPANSNKFLSDLWVPVHTLGNVPTDGSTQWSVEQSAVDGAIDNFIINNVGSGYAYVLTGTLIGAGSNTASLPAGASSITGAYVGCQIFITGGTGFPSSPRTITAYNGSTKIATLDSSWSADNTTTFEIWPGVVVSGNGTGATAKLIINTSGPNVGKIKQVLVTNAGSNYTYATASINGGGGAGASIRPVVSPKGGNGKDIEKELGAFFNMYDVRLPYDDGSGDIPLYNDYRIIGIVRDVLNSNSTLASASTRIGVKSLNIIGETAGIGGDFQPDELLTGVLGPNTAQAAAVEYISSGIGTGSLRFWQDSITGYNSFLDGMVVTGSISGATGTIAVSGVVDREVLKNSGEIIYIEYKRPIVRDAGQTEIHKCIIEF